MLNQNTYKKHAIGAAVAALVAGGAMAQSSAPEADGGKIQEVMVTAQRIAQPASKIPLSLSVVSGEDLKAAGAVNASSLTDLMPNVQIYNNGNTTDISIRGVTSADSTEKGDPSASFNVDGVNLARPQSAGLAFYDLERVEVLRGPQGTLYGRNATAGAVNLITNKPADKFESSAAVEFGNYSSVKFDGMLNVKINDMLAIRAAVASSKHDGYLHTTQGFSTNPNDDDTRSGRLQAMFKFTPGLSLLLSTDVSKIKGFGAGTVFYSTYLNKSGKDQRRSTPSVQSAIDDKASGTSAELKMSTGIGEFTYQAAHRNLDRHDADAVGTVPASGPGAVFNIDNQYAQTSHEMRLASSRGQLRTIGGLYWFKEQISVVALLDNFPGLNRLAFYQSPTISRSKAGFGEATYSLTPDLHVTAGVRRTNDFKSRVGTTELGLPVVWSSENNASVSYAQTTGKLAADYALAKNTMVYATLSTGYKAGGFNDGTELSNRFLRYAPEHLTSFETGIKGRFLNNKLQLNAAAFVYDYKDLQLSSLVTDPVTKAIVMQTTNAAKAKVSGLEFEGKYAISGHAKLNFSATYLDAHFTSYQPTPLDNWSGNRLEKSPKATVSLGYTYNWNLDNGAALSVSIGTRYSSSYVLNDYPNAVQLTQGAAHKSDLRMSYSPPGYKWYAQAYIRNIENESTITGYAPATMFGPAAVGLAPPRVAGITLGANF